jgi:ubiquinone/menaquinone biosynthesis C-methylase UbiE
MISPSALQEKNASDAFSKQSSIFDEEDKMNPVIQRMRKQVHTHLLSLLKPEDRILELNAGTGIDAIFLAQQGFEIVATDNAEGMLSVFSKKIKEQQLEKKIQIQRCSFNNLTDLQAGTFDHIFSNFGGLNCAENIDDVIKQFDRLLNPGGMATLVIMPHICPWELVLALKGNFKIAFRRLTKKGVPSHLEGVYFNTYYYSPKRLVNAFDKNKYAKICIKGLGILSPPPYLDKFPVYHPKIYNTLCKMEEKIDERAPFNSWADHFVITMKKN